MVDEWPIPDVCDELMRDFDLFNVEPADGDICAGWKEWLSSA